MHRSRLALLLCFIPSALLAAPGMRILNDRVEVLAAGEPVLQSPPEGLWSIACDWRDGWPADWNHGRPVRVTTEGPWTILEGEVAACGGVWSVRDAYRPEHGAIRGIRRFTWKGKAPAPKVTLSVRFQVLAADASRALLPGIVYYGNPSGARSGRVPVTTATPGEQSTYEEHRYPMPFASLELRRGSRLLGAALHTISSLAPYGNLPDQWWSLGVINRDGAAELTLLSGPCASNGKRSVIKGLQQGFMPYDNAWLNVEPGGVVEKSFFLEAFPVEHQGAAFQQPVRTSIAIFKPFYAEDLPEIAGIVQAKYRYAKTRWRETGSYSIFQKYVDRPFGVMGWTGQAEAPGYALQILAPGLKDPSALEYAQKSLDFLAGAAFYDGGFHNWYDLSKREWSRAELLNQGQAMLTFARAIAAGRAAGRQTGKWETFLRRAANLHADRILSGKWKPLSTNEASFIAPLVKASQLFKEPRYHSAALEAAKEYAARNVTMVEPYWGGTLDAQSEDKEAAALAFAGFLELYESTRSPEHLRWARHAADAMLTYSYVWDVPMPPGRLADHAMRTRGWTSVSPQNQHLDVWGALTAPDVYRLGQIDGREDLKRLALVMYRTCGQIVDPYGGQGEQMQQTNYAQRGVDLPLRKLRGGYHEDWTVFWITAHFLTGAARFVELGVPIWDDPR